MDNYFATRPAIFEVAIWISVVLLVLILLSLIYLFYTRVAHLRRERRIKAVEAIWIPVFKPNGSLDDSESIILRHWQYPYVLDTWASYRSLANKQRAKELDKIAVDIGLDNYIAKMLTNSGIRLTVQPVWLRVLAVSCAKWLHSDAIIKSLWEVLESNNRFLAVGACTCLIQLRAEQFEKAIIKILFRYPEEAATVTTQMGAAGGAEILHLLHSVLDKLPHYTLKNFITLAERSKDPSLIPILQDKLSNCFDDEEASALIRSIGHIGGPEQRDCLIPFLTHENRFLRIQAVKSLGHIGTEADIRRIEPHLRDSDWWLRYRSAEAIISLCDDDSECLENVINRQTDKYAADILRHAHAEKEWCLI